MKKVIALIILVLLLFNMIGCNFTGEGPSQTGDNSNQSGGETDDSNENNNSGETNGGEENNENNTSGETDTEDDEDNDTDLVPGGNYTGNPDAVYYAYINIDSYEDMTYAWKKYTEMNTKEGEQFLAYSFISNDDFKVIYTFYAYNAWIVPTEDIDEYFARIDKSGIVSGEECTMYYIGGGYCNCDNTDLHDVKSNEYMKSSHITISASPRGKVVDIEDISLITVDFCLRVGGGYQYVCRYDGEEAFNIKCCRKLTDEELSAVFSRIIIMRSPTGE